MFDCIVLTLYRFIIDFELSKFNTNKLQIVITFDRELRLRHFKKESCSKWSNRCGGHSYWGF